MGTSSSRKNKNKKSIDHENEISINLDDGLLCSNCGEIPEILNVHTDNSKIEFCCKNCGKYEILIDEYIARLSRNNYFKICRSCRKKGSKNKYYYCFNCKGNSCEECIKDYHSGHQYIDLDKKKTICFKHNKKFKYFCFDDQENLCEEDINEHKNHKIEEISKVINNEKLIDNIDEINKINKQLKNLIEINNIVLRNEEFFINSIKNIGKSLEEGNKRNSKDIKWLLNGLSRGIEISIKAIEELMNKYQIHLFRKDKYLHLYNRKLKDEGFKYISHIAFNQLKEIDISKNQIKDIKPFNKMSLPFLEVLNLSYNKIENIEPVSKLKSKNLKYIFLQRNQIEDIEPFLQSYFPALKILRVEGNNINGENYQDEKAKKKEIINKIKKKFSEKFIYKSLKEQLIAFNKQYNLGIYKYFSQRYLNIPEEKKSEEFQLIIEDGNENKIDIDKYKNEISEKDVENIVENIVNIDLSDIKGGDKMLEYLFLIIAYASENKIEKLILRNNNIKDASILTRINFSQLKILDISVNGIKDSNFLTDIKAENLENLYLDNKNFKEFYPKLNVNVNEILSEMEEKEFKDLYIDSEKNLSKDVVPLLKSKFKKLKNCFLNKQNINKEVEDIDASGNIIPDNILFCPECGKSNPEISKINVDNKNIEFHCKKCGEKEYNLIYFDCKESHDNKFYYIKPKNSIGESQYWFKEDRYRNINNRSEIKKTLCKNLENAKEIIKKKNGQLKEIIKFNQIIKLTSLK